MRKIFVVFFFLFIGCVAPQRRVDQTPFEKNREIKKEEEVLMKATTINDLKSIIIKSQFYSEKGKIVFCSSGKKNAEEVTKRLLKQFPNSLSCEDIGFSNYKKEDILSQFDSRNTPLFISVDSNGGDEILLEIFSVESGEKEIRKVECIFLKEEKNYSEFIMTLSIEPKSVCFALENEVLIWDGTKIVLLDLIEKKEKTLETFLCKDAEISNFGEGCVCFCYGNGESAKFEKKNEKWEKTEMNGYPLPERVLRFISAYKDENGFWALFDRKGDMLGEFTRLTKLIFRETTVFLALSPEGQIWGLRGDLISPVYSKENVLLKKIASSEMSAYALSQQGDLYEINLSNDFSLHLQKIEIDIGEQLVEIAVFGNRLYLFTKGENGWKLYRIYENGD